MNAMLNSLVKALLLLLGVAFMAALAFKKMPLPGTTIQMSLRSLSISILVITLGRKAFWVVLIYLLLATLGLPVLPEASSNPQWFLAPSAGYYFGFLLSAFILPHILARNNPNNRLTSWLSLSLNEATILSFGFIVLSFYIGPKQAWLNGVQPFLFGAILKITAATSIYYFKSRYQKRTEHRFERI